jgi:hypothetical protein
VIPPPDSLAGVGPIDYLLVVAVGVAVAAVGLELASTAGAWVAAVGVANVLVGLASTVGASVAAVGVVNTFDALGVGVEGATLVAPVPVGAGVAVLRRTVGVGTAVGDEVAAAGPTCAGAGAAVARFTPNPVTTASAPVPSTACPARRRRSRRVPRARRLAAPSRAEPCCAYSAIR